MTDESTDERRKALKETLEKCAETVNRAMLSLLAVSLFCLLTTFGATDRSLVAPEATIKVPFADAPISFVGFLIVAPLLLVVLTIYLHVFYGYWRELDTERRAQGLPETYPTLFSIDRRIGRLLTALIFYWLAPLVIGTMTWKAAARFEWGLPAALVTVLLTTGLVFLQFVRRGPGGTSRRMHSLSLGVISLLIVAAVIVGLVRYIDFLRGPPIGYSDYWQRPLNLLRADLRAAWLPVGRFQDADLRFADLQDATLVRGDLRGADLSGAHLDRALLYAADLSWANLYGAHLRGADLTGAHLTEALLTSSDLREANLTGAHLRRAHLPGADLTGARLVAVDFTGADLREANLTGAHLTGADLRRANLKDVKNLTCDQVRETTTDKTTELPVSLVCPKKWPKDKVP